MQLADLVPQYLDNRSSSCAGITIYAFQGNRTSRFETKQWYNLVIEIFTQVLFSFKDGIWKIADFGFAVDGSSRHARDTSKARGTSCYRSPELVKEEATFTNKVDIWSLGCILYELATGTTAFRNDMHTFEYSFKDTVIQLSVPDLTAFLQHHAAENIQELLHRDHEQRPSAATASQTFSAYCSLLSISSMQSIVASQSYPSYQEWKEVANNHVNEQEMLNQLAAVYEIKGNHGVATAIRREFIHRVAAEYWISGDVDTVIHIYEDAVEKEPLDFWLWHRLYEAHFANDGLDGAIAACKQGKVNYPNNPCPVMELCNLYAARGDYDSAISTYMDLASDWEGWSHMENVLSRAMMSEPGNKPEVINDLGRP
jgi:tetratricopeptide (TPR) repeat protein